jgi:hypothetical protein
LSKTEAMKVMSDLGENYEYLRVIVKNKLELKKLDLIEDSAQALGYGILGIISVSLLSLIVLGLSAVVIIWLISILQSTILSLLVFCGTLLTVLILLIVFRKSLIINPIVNIYYSFLKDRI